MRASTLAQQGSPSRDRFKYLHKHMLPRQAYALDSDLELVEKYPLPFHVARLDFKMRGRDSVSFAEALSYQRYVSAPMPSFTPVYLIEAYPQFMDDPCDTAAHRFDVVRFVSADYRPDPPKVKTELELSCVTWGDLSNWEMELRRQRKAQIAEFIRKNGRSAWDGFEGNPPTK